MGDKTGLVLSLTQRLCRAGGPSGSMRRMWVDQVWQRQQHRPRWGQADVTEDPQFRQHSTPFEVLSFIVGSWNFVLFFSLGLNQEEN